MPLSMTKGDGFTVYTVTSDPGSKLPLLCQVFTSLCCSPVCMVSGRLRKLMAGPQSALATVQIMAGLLTLGLGAVLMSVYSGPSVTTGVYQTYWSGGIFIVSGIFCLFAERFSSPCLVCTTVAVNLVSAVLTVAAIVLYSVDEGPRLANECLTFDPTVRSHYDRPYAVTVSPEQRNVSESNFRLCQMYRDATLPAVVGLKVLLGAFAALQFCINISVAVLAIKALKKNKREDPDVQQPLMEEVTANPVA
ncbi:uncharacterized protein LOC133137414 isoform X2 [Conger conger]|uniref:uncharacterized protein LOC133137414 isoform X2 n=1 Tax=Conger conger TaxID=82655 RepID=UPI002A5A4862|nr:uncharacterized protein LOC133137414 isoform X2 [Conger conger]